MKAQSAFKQWGQSLVEFALILPLLLMFSFFILDFSRAIYYYSSLQNAAREGARFGVTYIYIDQSLTSAIEDEIAKSTRLHLYGLPVEDVTVFSSITNGTDVTMKYLIVKTAYCYTPITPFVDVLTRGLDDPLKPGLLDCEFLELYSSSRMRIEARLSP